MTKAEKSGNISREFVIRNQYGIHARPAALFVKTAARFEAEVFVERGGNRVSGKSIMGLMTLAAPCGTRITLIIRGRDAQASLEALQKLIESGFEEQ